MPPDTTKFSKISGKNITIDKSQTFKHNIKHHRLSNYTAKGNTGDQLKNISEGSKSDLEEEEYHKSNQVDEEDLSKKEDTTNQLNKNNFPKISSNFDKLNHENQPNNDSLGATEAKRKETHDLATQNSQQNNKNNHRSISSGVSKLTFAATVHTNLVEEAKLATPLEITCMTHLDESNYDRATESEESVEEEEMDSDTMEESLDMAINGNEDQGNDIDRRFSVCAIFPIPSEGREVVFDRLLAQKKWSYDI
ncbi:hypothetical protein HAX54_027302 [Datura stramonium]|uniref:Uncharacterized protein n=1 Tax=Datura stramonium TaxID=4076 RepID=A0ABS8V2B4_DATST|nr:hypothetical protein [Datura stramonium]